MVGLEKIAAMNPWWLKGKDFKHYDRDLSSFYSQDTFIKFERLERLYARLGPGKVFIIKGPRRIGKTLMLKLLIEKLLDEGLSGKSVFYFSFDSIVTKKELDNMLRDFLMRPESGNKYVLLDEVQSVGGWEEIIKSLYDAGMLDSCTVIATGSVAHMLKVEMLPGRGVEGNTLLLRHLNFRDFALGLLKDIESKDYGVNRIGKLLGYRFTNDEMESLYKYIEGNAVEIDNGIDAIYEKAQELMPYSIPIFKLFEVYLNTGGYPISINDYIKNTLQPEKPSTEIDEDIYEEMFDYARQDAAMIGGKSIGDPAKASRIIEGVLASVGSSVSYSGVARRIGMNTATVISYFGRLENSFVFSPIYGLDRNFKDMKKSKIYFSDVFLHYACGAGSKGVNGTAYAGELIGSSSLGTVIEEMVLDHLIKTKEQDPMKHYKTFVRFYNDKGEIDFLYKLENGNYAAIEVKYRNSVQASRVKRLKKVADYLILSKNSIERAKDFSIIPVAFFLLLLQKSSSDI
jgi:predicted AAA+ superfamily ATPase